MTEEQYKGCLNSVVHTYMHLYCTGTHTHTYVQNKYMSYTEKVFQKLSCKDTVTIATLTKKTFN